MCEENKPMSLEDSELEQATGGRYASANEQLSSFACLGESSDLGYVEDPGELIDPMKFRPLDNPDGPPPNRAA